MANKSEVIVILDRSGSMQTIAEETVNGLNQFLDDQAKDPGETRVTLVQFDTAFDTLYRAVPAAAAPRLVNASTGAKINVTHGGMLVSVLPSQPIAQFQGLGQPVRIQFEPRGLTALCDAIGKTMTTEAERIGKEQWADNVVVCIVTDGGENASHDFNNDSVKSIITHCEKHNYRFVYLGANQDAFDVASKFGIARGQTATYTATHHGTMAAWNTASGVASMLKAAPDAQVNTTQVYTATLAKLKESKDGSTQS